MLITPPLENYPTAMMPVADATRINHELEIDSSFTNAIYVVSSSF
jgi:hypothetical protein